jgi:hypothetical protein
VSRPSLANLPQRAREKEPNPCVGVAPNGTSARPGRAPRPTKKAPCGSGTMVDNQCHAARDRACSTPSPSDPRPKNGMDARERTNPHILALHALNTQRRGMTSRANNAAQSNQEVRLLETHSVEGGSPRAASKGFYSMRSRNVEAVKPR